MSCACHHHLYTTRWGTKWWRLMVEFQINSVGMESGIACIAGSWPKSIPTGRPLAIVERHAASITGLRQEGSNRNAVCRLPTNGGRRQAAQACNSLKRKSSSVCRLVGMLIAEFQFGVILCGDAVIAVPFLLTTGVKWLHAYSLFKYWISSLHIAYLFAHEFLAWIVFVWFRCPVASSGSKRYTQ